jgi:hypothetical protein
MTGHPRAASNRKTLGEWAAGVPPEEAAQPEMAAVSSSAQAL